MYKNACEEINPTNARYKYNKSARLHNYMAMNGQDNTFHSIEFWRVELSFLCNQ